MKVSYYKSERFDIKRKNLLVRNYKYYVVDQGLRSYLLGKKTASDMWHILKNIVYLGLLRRGYKVYVGKVDALEFIFKDEILERVIQIEKYERTSFKEYSTGKMPRKSRHNGKDNHG